MLRETRMSAASELRVVPGSRVEGLFEISGPSTEQITVLFTGLAPTLRAVAVARGLGRALGAQVAVVVVKTPKYPPRGGQAPTTRDAEAEALQMRLRATGDIRYRVVAAPRTSEALSVALAPGSLVVVGGRRRWWPTPASRLCRLLEARGHYVLFVDEAHHAA